MDRNERLSGILLHLTCLPSPYGIGSLGRPAHDFVEYLSRCGSRIWQILPLCVTSYGDSPYQSPSAKGLNYYLIDLDVLREKGLLSDEECRKEARYEADARVDYGRLFDTRIPLLKKAFSRFDSQEESFLRFVRKGEYHDFAFFMTLKEMHAFRPWHEWEKPFDRYSSKMEKEIVEKEKERYLFYLWTQYEFLSQFSLLKAHCREKGILLMGDMPLYLSRDSVECYKYPELFRLDERGVPTVVAGCPPDYFSPKGQLWGNPIYDWDRMEKDGYRFFVDRINYSLRFFDILRIDHFRGFSAYYEIPFGREDAVIGRWVKGPGFALFKDLLSYPIVAEDLGQLDEDVYSLLRKTGYPGMKVLEFAFDGNAENDHLPSLSDKNSFTYTGTHDNMPLFGYLSGLSESAREVYARSLEKECEKMGLCYCGKTLSDLAKTTIRLAYASPSMACVIPMQDILLLGEESRMNTPSLLSTRNWSYRAKKTDFNSEGVDFVKACRKEGRRK